MNYSLCNLCMYREFNIFATAELLLSYFPTMLNYCSFSFFCTRNYTLVFVFVFIFYVAVIVLLLLFLCVWSSVSKLGFISHIYLLMALLLNRTNIKVRSICMNLPLCISCPKLAQSLPFFCSFYPHVT